MSLHDVGELHAGGHLDVGDGHQIYWEERGHPAGTPVVILHGGPGTGIVPSLARLFDPQRYRIVAFDQRNCGRSTPHASEPVVDLGTNTTAHLIGDIERLRHHLRIDRWVVWGGSWGTTLGLAYAQAHPSRVRALILVSVVTTTRREVDWVTRAMGRVFPEAWERFRDGVHSADRDGNLAAAYARLLRDADPAVRGRAAAAWCEWEDTHPSTVPGYEHDDRFDDPRFRLCFARLVTHYWAHAAFLEDDQVMRDAHRLAGIPGVLVTGRLDISSPPDVAWELAQRWREADLVLVDDAGHGAGHPTTVEAMLAASERFADCL